MNNIAIRLWQRFIAEYPVENLWKYLLSLAMPLAFVFIFVGNAVSYYPHWSLSIHNYSYDSPFLIGFPMAIIAVFAIWNKRPIVSLAASIIFIIPIINVMIYNASYPEKLTAVYYLELFFSLASVTASLVPISKKGNILPKPSENVNLSMADEIAKYKALLDDGIISESEYEAKKKELLK